MDTSEKINKLRDLMKERGLETYLIPSNDPHMGEYTADHWKTRAFMSGFTGSAGLLVVTLNEAALWTDGRYFIQAELQLKGSGIELKKQGLPDTIDYSKWINEKVSDNGKIGINGKLISSRSYDELTKKFSDKKLKLITEYSLPEMIWEENQRPKLPDEMAFAYEQEFAGVTVAEKIRALREKMSELSASFYITAGLEDIAWLFNIRGQDIPYLPVIYGYALVSLEEVSLCVDLAKIPPDLVKSLKSEGVTVRAYDEIEDLAGNLPSGTKLVYDPDKINRWLYEILQKGKWTCTDQDKGAGIELLAADDLIVKLKAIKNRTEIDNYRNCQTRDGVALTEFLYWIETEAEKRKNDQNKVTEWDCVLKLKELRAKGQYNRGESFPSIVGYGANGAMMHYAPNSQQYSQIPDKGLMVVDSGGQYLDGTTDITRTVVFNEVTDEEKRDFTLTLKAHIALASCKFLYGATGSNIDVIARGVMWNEGLDYKSGTGHGVGCFLSVHEGPQNISMRLNNVRLEENMIVSIEPGVYKEGKHGIRTENLVRICEDSVNENGRFMKFEVMSFCPISLRGIVPEMLTEKEKAWLNDYHAQVYERLSPFLNREISEWLRINTRAI